jgi:hypothetical protein
LSATSVAFSLRSIAYSTIRIILIQIYCGFKTQLGQQLSKMAFIFNFYIQCIGLWEQHHLQPMVMSLLQRLKISYIILFAFILKDFCLDFISAESILCHKCLQKNKMSCYKFSNNLKSTKMLSRRVTKTRKLRKIYTLKYFVHSNIGNIAKRMLIKSKNFSLETTSYR